MGDDQDCFGMLVPWSGYTDFHGGVCKAEIDRLSGSVAVSWSVIEMLLAVTGQASLRGFLLGGRRAENPRSKESGGF
jgi:hypothetical protein